MAPEADTPDLARLQALLPSIEPGEGRTASEQVTFSVILLTIMITGKFSERERLSIQ